MSDAPDGSILAAGTSAAMHVWVWPALPTRGRCNTHFSKVESQPVPPNLRPTPFTLSYKKTHSFIHCTSIKYYTSTLSANTLN
jgi:hypothetical protein